MQAVQSRQAFQLVPHAAPLCLEGGHQGGGDDRGRDAVLVAHVARIGAKADGLLVAEAEARCPGDPLETGECRVVLEAMRVSDA